MSGNSAKRLAMTARHLSSPASANPPTTPSEEGPVVFSGANSLRTVKLNRPRQANSLNQEMVDLLHPQLEKWNDSPLANVILFKGEGKGFCAGGDVKSLALQLADNDKEGWSKSAAFFQKEYALDVFIAKMKKPVVTFMTGNTMGGGVGLSVHAPFRIATETTTIAMPETKIGLFPDVGANFFLARLDGQLGLYLGLTGERVRGADAFFSGFASHYVPTERLASLEARLAELDQTATLEDIDSAIDEFAADAAELKEAAAKYSFGGVKRRAIDIVFAKKTAEEIVAELKAIEDGTAKLDKIILAGEEGEVEGLKQWAKVAREQIDLYSPTSVKVALKAIREGKNLDIEEAFLLDLRLATACCSPEVHTDFRTGVTHTLIDKSPGRAAWSPSTLAEVTDASIQSIFFSSPPPFTHPAVPTLTYSNSASLRPPYKSYPHAKFSLPSEKEIRDFITGEAKGSGDHVLTRADLINRLTKARGHKGGLKEKVDEVIKRRCQVSDDGYLKWRY
ncbi:ClpP/crotonase [Meredithblackwellia eburnea MCA 4105]